jgi:hypothetical protein
MDSHGEDGGRAHVSLDRRRATAQEAVSVVKDRFYIEDGVYVDGGLRG